MYYNEKIAYERDKQNITQKEMAFRLGIKQQQYSRYEKGINVMPVTYLPKICKILNVSADYILGLKENSRNCICIWVILRTISATYLDV